MAGLALPSGRSFTSPTTCTQYSLRSSCAMESSRITTWTTPETSRRSMKATPPWSRRRATHPANVTLTPASSARSVPGVVRSKHYPISLNTVVRSVSGTADCAPLTMSRT